MSLMLEVVLNGKPSQQVIPVSYRAGHFYISSKDFNALGLPVKNRTEPEVEIDTIDGLKVNYEGTNQQLLIQVPTDWLPEQNISDYKTTNYDPADSIFGLLFNYDLYANHTTGNQQNSYTSAYTEQRLLSGFGVLLNNGVYNQNIDSDISGPSSNRYLRYDTKWYYNDEKRMLQYSVGDIITGSLPWSTSVRLGGLQISRNFSTRPDLITYPLPQFAGQASVPSAVDVYINSYKYSSANVDPGPFAIETMPYINGAGNATVVVTDPLGRRVNTSVPFYVSSDLLRKGLFDFSASAGKIRNNYGIDNFDYDNNAASATFRYGLTNWLTLEGRAEGARDLHVEGAGGNLLLGSFGVLSGSYTTSHAKNNVFKPTNTFVQDSTSSIEDTAKTGHQRSMGYSYNQRLFSINAQRTIRSEEYGDLSTYKNYYQLDKQIDQITASTSLGRIGTLGAGYFDIKKFDQSRLRLLNISYNTTLFGENNLYASVNREIGSSGFSAQIIISIPLSDRGGASLSSSRDKNSNWAHQISYNRTAPTDGGLGWNVSYAKKPSGQSDYKQASLDMAARKVRIQGGFYGDNDQTYWGELSGSLVAVKNNIYASRVINDSFALISTTGYPEIPVKYENQPLGITDSDGYLLIPGVTSYTNGKYSIDPSELPADVKVPVVEQFRTITKGSGTVIEFPITKIVPATLTLVDESGLPLPRGSIINLNGTENVSYVGWDGDSYLENIAQKNEIVVQRADNGAQCKVHFNQPQSQPEGVIALDTLVCRSDSQHE